MSFVFSQIKKNYWRTTITKKFFCWVKLFDGSTDYKKSAALLDDVCSASSLHDIIEEYGVTRSTHNNSKICLCKNLGYKNFKELRNAYNQQLISKESIKKAIKDLKFSKVGRPTLLFTDEESLFVAATEMRGLVSQPKTRRCFAIQLNNAIQDLIEKKRGSAIAYK